MAVRTPMLTAGYAGTGVAYGVLANRKVIDMRDKLYLLQPDAAPLYVMTSRLKKQPTGNQTLII